MATLFEKDVSNIRKLAALVLAADDVLSSNGSSESLSALAEALRNVDPSRDYT